MQSFLHQYTAQCLQQNLDFSQHVFILPSRRAVNFFKKELVTQNPNSFFLPKICSIEDFIAEIAEVEIIDSFSVLFEFYKVYIQVFPKEKQESFETVYNWAQTLIQDFNEIDRHLIQAEDFFGNLANVKEIDHWSKAEQPTSMVKNYLEFWRTLPKLYTQLSENLRTKKQVYQGLAYKMAVEQYHVYLNATKKQLHYVGFNALNASEQELVQKTLTQQKGTAVWDIDAYLLADKYHPASTFLNQYQQQWTYFQKKENKILPSTTAFTSPKEIHTYAIPKKIGQAKTLGQILVDIPVDEYSETAVVLADEAMLQPVLNAIPSSIPSVNITMGLALKYTPLASFFEQIIRLQLTETQQFFFKDVLQVCAHPSFKMAFPNESQQLQATFVEQNILFLQQNELMKMFSSYSEDFQKALHLVFSSTHNNPHQLLQNSIDLCTLFRHYLKENTLQLQYVYAFHQLFLGLKQTIESTGYVQNNTTFFYMYKDVLAQQTLDFQGSPFEGIQLMGMLETRVLDFKNVIILSVNEGVLPTGKSDNSYIPFDLKTAFQLPTYKDKDAIYAYHFFRLIQRAKKVHLLYNNDAGGLDKAEPSRFLRYFDVFPQQQHKVHHHVVAAKLKANLIQLQVIPKTPSIMQQLKELFTYGISPSALTTYIRNPLDFYKRYVLRIDELEEMDEEISFRSYGNILHETLQNLYHPYQGKSIQQKDMEGFLSTYETELIIQFGKHYNADAIHKGKNKIAFEIAKQQCRRFFKHEIKNSANQELKILAIEKNKKLAFSVPGIDFPIQLKGTADRVDVLGNTFRIIDYKTGKVLANDVVVPADWQDFTQDYKYSKAFQVLFYAVLFEDEANGKPMESGIISFKNLNSGFLKFGSRIATRKVEYEITSEILHSFKEQLSVLIQEILNPTIPFTEKEV